MKDAVKDNCSEMTESFKDSLLFMNEIVNRLETLGDKNIEKMQCVESLKDNIEIMLNKLNDLSNQCINTQESTFSTTKAFCDEFTMENTRVLIVDDNEINNYVVEQMLKRFNIEVDVALSGEMALDLYSKNDYDLILLDYLMPPGIDGIETAKRIREMGEKGKKQLIIGLTANTVEIFKEGLNKYNVELILFKPVKYQQMAVILQKEISYKIKK